MRLMSDLQPHETGAGRRQLIHDRGVLGSNHRDVPAARDESAGEQPHMRRNAASRRLEDLDDAAPLAGGGRRARVLARASYAVADSAWVSFRRIGTRSTLYLQGSKKGSMQGYTRICEPLPGTQPSSDRRPVEAILTTSRSIS